MLNFISLYIVILACVTHTTRTTHCKISVWALNSSGTSLTDSFVSVGHEEEDVLKGRKTFRGLALVSQSPEAELMLEGEDDTVSLLQDKDMDNLAGEGPKKSTDTLTS